MTKDYKSDVLRMIVRKKKEDFGEVIHLEIQEAKPMLFLRLWKNVKAIDIQLKEYWNPTRGTKYEIMDHLTMYTAFGDVLEVWYPEDFDLEKRMAALWAEYFTNKRGELKAKIAMDKATNH